MTSTENISVYVRVRPLNESEKSGRGVWKIDDNAIYQSVDASGNPVPEPVVPTYTLDRVFGESRSTEEVYQDTVQSLIQQVVEGFNSTVFAYGQTSSGKTHTMRGTVEEPGIIPLAVKEIFEIIQDREDREFLLRVSYMEIYNEDIKDLLAPDHMKLAIHESRDSGVYVAGLREEIASSPDQVMEQLNKGEAHRHVGETKMNKNSSRSHSIFRMVVESRSRNADDDSAIRVSTLSLVDLAGSERIAKTGAEGQRMKEGAAINKSLLTLGTVINKLSEGSAGGGGHIPYRDSKLTRILQPSLGGNAKTAIICAITPANEHSEESHSTLRFACRAKRVVNSATVNEVLSDDALLKRQAKEIAELRQKLESSGNMNCMDEEIVRLREQMLRKEQEKERMLDALAAEKEQRERAQRQVESMTRMMLQTQDSIDANTFKEKKRKGNRRETWCPGEVAKKRAALHDVARAEQELPASSLRKSDGGALLQHAQGHNTEDEGEQDVQMESDDPDILKARIKELETANRLIQRELDAVTHAAQDHNHQLKAAEDELMSVADERDQLVPMLKEAQWRIRQLEKDLAQRDAVFQDASEKIQQLETKNSEILKLKDQELQASEEKLSQISLELEKLKVAKQEGSDSAVQLIETQAELQKLQSKYNRLVVSENEAKCLSDAASQEVAALKTQLAQTSQEIENQQTKTEELTAEVSRLNSHISDLEKRKRAPLYQKKQEDELRAAMDRAKDAESRATQAEFDQQEAQKELSKAETNFLEVSKQYEDKIADLEEEIKTILQKLEATTQLASSKQIELQAELDTLRASNQTTINSLMADMGVKDEQIKSLEHEIKMLQEQREELTAQMAEAQECADAASAHVRFLEEKAEKEGIEMQEQHRDLEARFHEELERVDTMMKEQEAILENAKLENEALQEVNKALELSNEELESKIKFAANTLNAAEELKELKRKHKDEVAKLNLALKNATLGNKGNEKVAERALKESERLKNQVKDIETKLRAAISDRSTSQSEKAGLERELRTTKAQLEKATKSANRITAIEEKKREAISNELKLTKEHLVSLKGKVEESEEVLEQARQQIALLESDLEMLRTTNANLDSMIEQKDLKIQELEVGNETLSAKCMDTNAELESVRSSMRELESLISDKNALVERLRVEIKEHITSQKASDVLVRDLKKEIAGMEEEKVLLQTDIDDTKMKLSQAYVHTEELNKRAHDLDRQVEVLKSELKDWQGSNERNESEIRDLKDVQSNLSNEVQELHANLSEKDVYISALENQVNDLTAQEMESRAEIEATRSSIEKIEGHLQLAERKIASLENSLEESRERLKEATSEHEQVVVQLQSELTTLKSSNMSATKSFEDLNVAHNELKIAYIQLEDVHSQLQAEHDGLKSEHKGEIEELSKKINLLEENKASLVSQLSSTEQKIEIISSKFREAQEQLKLEKQKNQQALASAHTSVEELQQMQEQVYQSDHMLAENRKEMDNLQSRLASMQNALEVLELDKHQLTLARDEAMSKLVQQENVATNLQTSMDTLIAEHQTSSQTMKMEIEALKQRVQQDEQVKSKTAEEVSRLNMRCSRTEQEVRKSKRREEKLQALLFRLKEDMKECLGSPEFFDRLKDARALEYEMDRAANKAKKEIESLRQQLSDARNQIANSNKHLQSNEKNVLAEKENVP